METISYLISLVATIMGLIEPFFKKMRTVLIFNLIGNLLVGTSYLMVDRLSGFSICMVAALGLIINYGFLAKGKVIPKSVVVIQVIAFLAVNLITFKELYDLLALLASMLFVLSIAQESTKYYRLLYVSNSMVWIAYDILAGAYGNLFTHVVLFIAISVAIFARDVQRQKKRNNRRRMVL